MIQKFSLSIYPRHLFVARESVKEEIRDKILNENGEQFTLEDLSCEDSEAFVYGLVQEKETGDYGSLVVLSETATADVFAHESVHCAISVFKQLNIKLDSNNDEPLAYLIQFLFKCINKAAAISEK